MGDLSIPRCHKPVGFGIPVRREVHCFCDASLEAIGYVVYLRLFNSLDKVAVTFLCGSSRVAPRSANTIPRLELCAAMEAARATCRTIHELGLSIDETYYYSDSKVFLGYITNSSKKFSLYVTRRVSDILQHSSVEQWSHIAGRCNIGDIASRPQHIGQFLQSCWLTGPDFLSGTSSPVVTMVEKVDLSSLPEVKCNRITVDSGSSGCTVSDLLCARVSTWTKAVSVMILVLKFVSLFRKEKSKFLPNADQSSLVLLRDSQQRFSEDIRELQSGGSPSGNALSSLSPFIDSDGLLRVGGRLKDSEFPGDMKYPIVLPSNHPVTLLIIDHCHRRVRHQGRTLTLGALRQAGYHVIRGSAAVKTFIRRCVTCRKLRGDLQIQIMADLPKERFDQVPPFTHVGVDLCGPYLIHDGTGMEKTQGFLKKPNPPGFFWAFLGLMGFIVFYWVF